MDITMPRMNGIEATREIVSRCPQAKVIGVSMHTADDMARSMLKGGAVADVPKAGPPD